MRIDFVGDTNFIIYLLEGYEAVDSFLSYRFGISFVTEIELLGFRDLDSAGEANIQRLISDVLVLGWYPELRNMTISLRKKHAIKLPDAIVAATSMTYGVPLVTADRGFSKIEDLDLILLDMPRS